MAQYLNGYCDDDGGAVAMCTIIGGAAKRQQYNGNGVTLSTATGWTIQYKRSRTIKGAEMREARGQRTTIAVEISSTGVCVATAYFAIGESICLSKIWFVCAYPLHTHSYC